MPTLRKVRKKAKSIDKAVDTKQSEVGDDPFSKGSEPVYPDDFDVAAFEANYEVEMHSDDTVPDNVDPAITSAVDASSKHVAIIDAPSDRKKLEGSNASGSGSALQAPNMMEGKPPIVRRKTGIKRTPLQLPKPAAAGATVNTKKAQTADGRSALQKPTKVLKSMKKAKPAKRVLNLPLSKKKAKKQAPSASPVTKEVQPYTPPTDPLPQSANTEGRRSDSRHARPIRDIDTDTALANLGADKLSVDIRSKLRQSGKLSEEMFHKISGNWVPGIDALLLMAAQMGVVVAESGVEKDSLQYSKPARVDMEQGIRYESNGLLLSIEYWCRAITPDGRESFNRGSCDIVAEMAVELMEAGMPVDIAILGNSISLRAMEASVDQDQLSEKMKRLAKRLPKVRQLAWSNCLIRTLTPLVWKGVDPDDAYYRRESDEYATRE